LPKTIGKQLLQRQMLRPTTPSSIYTSEADVIHGLEPIAREEIKRLITRDAHVTRPGVLQFVCSGELRRLSQLKTALAVYLVQRLPVPRPKALLGDQHLRALLAQIQTALDLNHGAYRTFMLGAAGSDSAVMARLKAEIARHTQLQAVSEDGDLLVRLRPSHSAPSPQPSPLGGEGAGGWDALVRLSPKPLATRAWRVCNVDGSLQATVAHAMALLTEPKPGDVYLNLCCGSGTLLIERALAGKAAQLTGCDINREALICASRNIAAYRKGAGASAAEIKLHDWDATRLPLPDASVDAIVADLPFGNLVGSHAGNAALYPALLREAARVAKPGARFVVITAEIRLLEAALAPILRQWEREQALRVNLGGLRPMIFVLRRV
jgi:SAM-dependent methyltransferase